MGKLYSNPIFFDSVAPQVRSAFHRLCSSVHAYPALLFRQPCLAVVLQLMGGCSLQGALLLCVPVPGTMAPVAAVIDPGVHCVDCDWDLPQWVPSLQDTQEDGPERCPLDCLAHEDVEDFLGDTCYYARCPFDTGAPRTAALCHWFLEPEGQLPCP